VFFVVQQAAMCILALCGDGHIYSSG
jgi:hypothetical protein